MTSKSSDKPQHIAAPALCSTCSSTMRSRVEIGTLSTGFTYCPHRRALAIFTTENNRIVGMNLVGPILVADAIEHVEKLAANLGRGLAASDLHPVESQKLN